jgi:hypothetical protein
MARSAKLPKEIRTSFRYWIGAVALDGAAVVLLIVLAATHSASYGTVGGGATANRSLLELLLLVAAVVLIDRMRAGAEWARFILGAVSLPIVTYLVLQLFVPVGHGVSTVNLLRLAIAATRFLEVFAVVAAVWMMYRPAAKGHFVG